MTDHRKPTLAAILTVSALAAAGCKFPYPPDVGDPDATAACEPNTTTCTGNTLTVCDAAGDATTTTCGFGCFSGEDRCADSARPGLCQNWRDEVGRTEKVLDGQVVEFRAWRDVSGLGGEDLEPAGGANPVGEEACVFQFRARLQ